MNEEEFIKEFLRVYRSAETRTKKASDAKWDQLMIENRARGTNVYWQYNLVDADEKGLHFDSEYSHCGSCDTDTDYITLPWRHVLCSDEEFEAFLEEYREQTRIEVACREQRKLKEQEEARLKQEEQDRKEFERLKVKYGNEPR